MSTATPFRKVLVITVLIAASLMLVFTSFLEASRVDASRANELAEKIRLLEERSAQYQQEAEHLRHEAASLENTINALNAEKEAIQGQIDISQTKYDHLLVQIAETEQKIEEQKVVLGNTLANLYVDSDVTAIELIAGSKSIGDFMDRQGARSAIRDQLNKTLKKVKQLKQELDEQKVQVEQVLVDLRAQREALSDKEAEQARLLAQTRGEEARFQQLHAETLAQRAAVYKELESLNTSNISIAPTGYVTAGTVIGYVGNTGYSFGAHLHLEARLNGGVVDPNPYLNSGWQRPTSGYISQGYGNFDPSLYGGNGTHPGIDYAPAGGTPIRAVADGMLYRDNSGTMLGTRAYGCVAVIEHGGNLQSLYGHMTNSSCQ